MQGADLFVLGFDDISVLLITFCHFRRISPLFFEGLLFGMMGL